MKKWLGGISSHEKKFIFFYIVSSLLLFFYSFTQIDLGLTLTRASFLASLERGFQYVGYFNRPLSTVFYLSLVSLFFALYITLIRQTIQKRISEKAVWLIILAVAIILTLSYTAFSYDIFNYIFDAKIFTFYHQNPYLHKALDFPGDPMLSFMHWTHRTYPYGPVWLLITAPLSFVGLQYFLPTYFLFKIIAAGSYLLSVWTIGKIAKKLFSQKKALCMALFALNPLVLFEVLISGHNDIGMLALGLLAFYFLIEKRGVLSYLFLFLSIGLKYATVFLLPVFLLISWNQRRKKEINWMKMIEYITYAMLFAVLAVSFRTNFQPWYLLYALPFAALLPEKRNIISIALLSFVALLNYVPFLYLGNWDSPVPTILLSVNLLGVILAASIFILKDVKEK